MAYQIGPNGLPMVGGVALPLTPDQLAAQGVSPEQAPGGIPMPPMQNPFGGLPPDAVAGPGGGPVLPPEAPLPPPQALPPGAVRSRFGQIIQQPPQVTVQHRNRFGGTFTTQEDAPPPVIPSHPHEAPPSEPAKLIPTVAEAQQTVANPGDPLADKAAEWEFNRALRAGQGGPRRLGEVGETQKYTQYGTVPEALASDIDARQAAVDKAQAAGFETVAKDNATALDRQREVIQQQQADAQAAAARQQMVAQRIADLQAKSDASEAELAQAKPKQASEFFGGNAGASILAALAVALGAKSQVLSGARSNPGADVVNGAIDRWVNDQVQTYNAAKDKATVDGNAYKNALQVYGTPEAAEAQVRLQALAAKNALAQNMADQSKNQQWLANAQLMQQDDQLKRQQLRAQSIQQAGMREVESKLTMQGGPGGSAVNPYKAAAEAKAATHKAVREGSDTTNEDIRTNLEEKKAAGTASSQAKSAIDAADAIQRFADKSNSLADRASPKTKGEIADAREAAIGAYARHLVVTGQASPRAAREEAKQYFGSADDFARSPATDSRLRSRAKTLRGFAVRANAAGAAGIDVPADTGDVGEPE